MKKYPPKIFLKFFRWFCHPKMLDYIEGDLMEVYEKRLRKSGKRIADIRFVIDVILLFRRGIIKPKAGFKHLNNYSMIKSYFKIGWRNIRHNKVFSFINISGLAVGIACSMLIFLWVNDELSYDNFHRDGERMYRINLRLENSDIKAAVSCVPLAQAMKRNLPGVEDVIRLSLYNNDLLQVGNKVFEENRIIYVDSNFFDFFTFPLVFGNPTTALSRPENIILTEEMAIKYFGTTDAIGKTIRRRNQDREFVVTGVLKNIPSNSHLQFNFIQPMSLISRTFGDFVNNRWDNFGWYTYVKFEKPATSEELIAKGEQVNEIYRANEKTFKADWFFEPMSDIHFTPGLLVDVQGITDQQYIYIFSIVGLFILAVACINFMNLATARSARRAKEVGLRKVAGAFRTQLIFQFLSESMVIAAASLIFALVIVIGLLPFFDDLTGKSFSNAWRDPQLLFALLGITMITGLLAGIYPAFFLSRFVPAKVLKGGLVKSGASSVFRNTLVTVQFSITIMLLVGTAVVFQQMQFISNRNLGYDKENLLYLPIKGDLGKDVQRLKTLLESNSSTSNFSIISQLPTNLENGTTQVDWDGKDKNSQVLFPNIAVDENFFEVFKTTLLSGRAFSRDLKSDSANYMVNEEVLKIMKLTPGDAVGKRFSMFGIEGVIVGVVKNFNFKSLQTAIEPMILQPNFGFGNVVVRTQPGQLDLAIQNVREICQALNPQYPFSYSFVDDDFARIYQSEHRLGKLFGIFTALGLIISCLGLYGLSAFLAERSTKEIGVRKVLGASVPSITWLLSKNFTRPIFIAAVIASPVAWLGMNKWLGAFAYRIDIGWEIFVVAFGLSLLVAFVTVSYETVKAALANPARSLRNE